MPTVTMRTVRRSVVTITPPPLPPIVAINRVALTAHINDLQDVDISALPQPYPDDINFSEDQKFYLAYDPTEAQWTAEREPTVTEVDGGTY